MVATMEVLKSAVDVAKKKDILTIIVASTTGDTASKLLELVETEKLRTIVVTHDEGKPPEERRFSETIREKLLANGVTVYTHNRHAGLLYKIMRKISGRFGIPRWYAYLGEIKAKYGTGIKVCHMITQMLLEGGLLRDDRIVAIAGTKKGADSACVFSLKSKNKWPILEEVIISHQ